MTPPVPAAGPFGRIDCLECQRDVMNDAPAPRFDEGRKGYVCEFCRGYAAGVQADRDALQARVTALEGALATYGRHRDRCRAQQGLDATLYPCDCGLDAARAPEVG